MKRFYGWSGDRLVTSYGCPTRESAEQIVRDLPAPRVEERDEEERWMGRLNPPDHTPRMRLY